MPGQLTSTVENTTRVEFLNKKNEEIYQDLREHVKESKRYKKERIEMLEGNYRELITRKAIDIPVAHIARQMINDLREHGIEDSSEEGISARWIYENTSPDCKTETAASLRPDNINSGICSPEHTAYPLSKR